MTDRKTDDDHFRETEALQRKMLKLNQDTTILFIQTQSSRKRSLKKLQQVYLLASTPSFTTIS